MPKKATGSRLATMANTGDTKAAWKGRGDGKNRGWSSRQHGGGWPSYSGTASSSALGAVYQSDTTTSGRNGPTPEAAAPPRPRILSEEYTLRSTASHTLAARTLTAQWSMSHGRMFHSYFYLKYACRKAWPCGSLLDQG